MSRRGDESTKRGATERARVRISRAASAAHRVPRSPAADARCARVVARRPNRDTRVLSSMHACVRRLPQSSLRLPWVAHNGSGKNACTRAAPVHCAKSRGTLLLASSKKHLTGHVHTAARRAAGLLRSTTLSKPRPASGQIPAISVPSPGRAGWVRPRAPGRTQRQGLDRRGPVCERLSRSRPESAGDVP
jgi:hypothetical protein